MLKSYKLNAEHKFFQIYTEKKSSEYHIKIWTHWYYLNLFDCHDLFDPLQHSNWMKSVLSDIMVSGGEALFIGRCLAIVVQNKEQIHKACGY